MQQFLYRHHVTPHAVEFRVAQVRADNAEPCCPAGFEACHIFGENA